MKENSQLDAEQLRKIREDILDSIDEELEMAMEDGENENDPFASDEEKKFVPVIFVNYCACKVSWSSCKTGLLPPNKKW